MVAVRSGDVNWIGVGSGDDLWLPQGEFFILDSWGNIIWPPEDGVPPSSSTSRSVPQDPARRYASVFAIFETSHSAARGLINI